MQNNITLYTSPEGNVSVQVQFEDGTFWLTPAFREIIIRMYQQTQVSM